MMLARTYIALLMGLLLTPPAHAQPNDTARDTPYFHTAAQQYLDGALPQARTTVDEGLRADPGNPRLLALRAKIEQQRPPSNEDDAAEQDQSEEDASSQPQNRTEQPEQDDGSAEQEDGSAGQEEQDERSPEDPTQDDPSAGGTAEEAPPPGEDAEEYDMAENTPLSPAEANRILRALENQEKQLLRQVQKRTPRPRRIEKEW